MSSQSEGLLLKFNPEADNLLSLKDQQEIAADQEFESLVDELMAEGMDEPAARREATSILTETWPL